MSTYVIIWHMYLLSLSPKSDAYLHKHRVSYDTESKNTLLVEKQCRHALQPLCLAGRYDLPHRADLVRGDQRALAALVAQRNRRGTAPENLPQPQECHPADVRHQHRVRPAWRIPLLHRTCRGYGAGRRADVAAEHLCREPPHQREPPPQAAHPLRAKRCATTGHWK